MFVFTRLISAMYKPLRARDTRHICPTHRFSPFPLLRTPASRSRATAAEALEDAAEAPGAAMQRSPAVPGAASQRSPAATHVLDAAFSVLLCSAPRRPFLEL